MEAAFAVKDFVCFLLVFVVLKSLRTMMRISVSKFFGVTEGTFSFCNRLL